MDLLANSFWSLGLGSTDEASKKEVFGHNTSVTAGSYLLTSICSEEIDNNKSLYLHSQNANSIKTKF